MDLVEFKDEYKHHIIKHAKRNFSFHFDFFEIDLELMGEAEIKEVNSSKDMVNLFMSKALTELKADLKSFIFKLAGITTLEKKRNVYIGCQRYTAGHFLKPHTDRGQSDYG